MSSSFGWKKKSANTFFVKNFEETKTKIMLFKWKQILKIKPGCLPLTHFIIA